MRVQFSIGGKLQGFLLSNSQCGRVPLFQQLMSEGAVPYRFKLVRVPLFQQLMSEGAIQSRC